MEKVINELLVSISKAIFKTNNNEELLELFEFRKKILNRYSHLILPKFRSTIYFDSIIINLISPNIADSYFITCKYADIKKLVIESKIIGLAITTNTLKVLLSASNFNCISFYQVELTIKDMEFLSTTDVETLTFRSIKFESKKCGNYLQYFPCLTHLTIFNCKNWDNNCILSLTKLIHLTIIDTISPNFVLNLCSLPCLEQFNSNAIRSNYCTEILKESHKILEIQMDINKWNNTIKRKTLQERCQYIVDEIIK